MKGGAEGPPTVRILTLGCAKNSVDSEVMAGLLSGSGFAVVPSGPAEIGIVNTCGFIHDAREESVDGILALAREKARGRIRWLVVAGCLAARERENLPGALPEVDLFVGPGDIPALPGMVRDMIRGAGPRPRVGDPAPLPEKAYRRRLRGEGGPSAFLKILEGCDHRCSYCAIPAIRGSLSSRLPGDVVLEARSLARTGAREINLVGQDISSFGADRGERGSVVPLVRRICRIPGIHWVRLLYLHPRGIDDALIDLVASEEKVCRYLDIPVQHADPDVLRRMGRDYGPEEIGDLVDRLRGRFPGLFLRTSVITGFPGETARAFDRLLRFVHETRWDYLGVFPYSREEGTKAAGMRPRVPGKTARERARLVQDAQADILAARNAALAGSTVEVLVEKTGGRGRALGRHAGQAPEVDGSVVLSGYRGEAGRFVRVRVTGAREWDLFAKPIDTGGPSAILT